MANKYLKKLAILLSVIFITLNSALVFSKVDDEVRIYTALKSLPKFYADPEESEEDRNERIRKLSLATYNARFKKIKGMSNDDFYGIMSELAYAETKFALLVSQNRCSEMPKGQRCDGGKAKTYFQLHEAACPAVWNPDLIPGSQEELNIAAECAAKQYTYAYHRCLGKNKNGDIAGGFSGYRSIDCNWEPSHSSPKERAKNAAKHSYKISQVR